MGPNTRRVMLEDTKQKHQNACDDNRTTKTTTTTTTTRWASATLLEGAPLRVSTLKISTVDFSRHEVGGGRRTVRTPRVKPKRRRNEADLPISLPQTNYTYAPVMTRQYVSKLK